MFRQDEVVDTMSVKEERLWKILEQKTWEEDEILQPDRRISNKYLSEVELVCDFAIERAKTIRDTFPMYTLHDETHICNVLRIMDQLLGDRAGELTRDEAAMLILAACCHDIGMSYSKSEKEDLLRDRDRLDEYLERHHSEYVKAYTKNPSEPELTDELLSNYLRSIHHERILEVLNLIEWPDCLWGKVDRDDLVRVCQSHGEDSFELNDLESTSTVDLRFCAILLRLADILDFDTTRAPKTLYRYIGFGYMDSSEAKISQAEWYKHMGAHGFDFDYAVNRGIPCDLPCHVTSRSMQIEQATHCYLDWVDEELSQCGALLRRFTGRWQSLVLPSKIKRTIKAEGYVSGQYRLTMDQDKVMELLVGEDLYSDPSAFVRELIQNAIDAVRTREQLDRQRPRGWRPQINIRSWMDEEGYHWFRIEDNGTGMTKEILENYFLKIGRSYYTSDTFEKEKVQCGADPNFTPISRFGIGILSCFMGGKNSNQVEVSTKRFGVGGEHPSPLRLSMHGMNGYYYLASKREGHDPGPMKGETKREKEPYLYEPGTVVAVRTNLYQTGKYVGFKEIVDRYVVYPPVPVHYDGPDGSCDYITQEQFMKAVHRIHPSEDLEQQGVWEFAVEQERLQELYEKIPGLYFDKLPKIIVKCIPLDRYTKSTYFSGALMGAKLIEHHNPIIVSDGKNHKKIDVDIGLSVNITRDVLSVGISLNFDEEEEVPIEWEYREHFLHGYDLFQARLREIPGYQEYFLDVYTRTGQSNITAHNGVFCGDGCIAGVVLDVDYDYEALGSIVLFSDQYRPGVDISRSKIREISLEMACDILLVQNKLEREGYSMTGDSEGLLREKPWMIPTSTYHSLLRKRPDFVENLIINTEEGECGCGDLKLQIEQSHQVVMCWEKSNLSCVIHSLDLGEQLKFAYLKEHYDLRMSMDADSVKVYIREKTAKNRELDDDIFPPSLFVYPDTECRYLTGKFHFCNADHRLSQFVMINANVMQKRVPGLLKEMIRILQQESGGKLVSAVNEILDRLRRLPGQPIPVPLDVYLTMEDLCMD